LQASRRSRRASATFSPWAPSRSARASSTSATRRKTVAWHDPEALDPASLSFGGSWGSFWYRGFVYASDVTRGLDVFRLEDRSVKAKAVKVDFLNPQTLIWEQPAKKKRKKNKHS
jgi:hypothetical protein